MIKKKTLAIAFAIMLSASWNISVADSVYDEPQKTEQKKEIPNPVKEAKKRTDEMDRLLSLSEKQYKKIYKLYLKEEKEKVEKMFSRSGGQPPMNGGRPPMGMGQPPVGGGFPPMSGNHPGFGEGGPMMPPEHIKEKMAEEMRKREEKMLKKIRKILDDEQYEKWLEMKPKAPGKPLPGADRPKPQDL